MGRLSLVTLQALVATAALGIPAAAQATEAPQPAWRIVTYVLVGIVLLAILLWTAMAINRRREPGETPVEGTPPAEGSDATPGPPPYGDEGRGTGR